MCYNAEARNLRCPFCGSERLDREQDTKLLAPSRVVPFRVDRQQAENTMRGWLRRGFWRPGDLATAAAIEKMTPVLVPYWVFQATTFTYWTADTSKTPPGARGDWYPLYGEHRGSYQGLLIGASGALTPAETSTLCPFDLGQALALDQVDLKEMVIEQFRVQRKYARPLAQQGLEQRERDACQVYVPARARNLKVNVRLEGLSSEPISLPVWIMSYRYGERMYRFLINGQTGEPTGEAPVSKTKIAVAIALVVLCLVIALLVVTLAQAF
jgi:hypothetical protein